MPMILRQPADMTAPDPPPQRNSLRFVSPFMKSHAFAAFVTLPTVFCILEGNAQDRATQLASLPLSTPLSGEGATLFQTVSPDESNIHFVNAYDHPERWTTLWHQYFLGSIGTGIALGDVNGDGLADIYAMGKDSPNALYLNNGDFSFIDATAESGVAGRDGIGAGVSMVDIDNDGDLDIYATYTGFANELFINDGKGVFTESARQWGLDIETGSNAPAFADYDRDGDLDLYLQCNFLTASGLPEGMPDLLFENLGERFVEVTAEAGIEGRGQGHAAIWWDYNEDGWQDIYIANDFEPADKLYRNNKDGTFTDVIKEVMVWAPYSAMGADIGDVNNDGHIDLFVAEMATKDHVKHHRTVGMINFKLLRAPTGAVSQYMNNMLAVKAGPNQFIEVGHLAGLEATDWTWSPRFADLDNDGWLDAYFTNGMARAFHDGDIGLRSLNVRGTQRMAYYKASPRYDERNLVYRNEGHLRFKDVSAEWGLDLLGVSFGSAFADFDLDGDLDIVVSNLSDNLALYRNNSVAGNRVAFRLVGEKSNRYGIGAKLRLQTGGMTQAREMTLTRGYLSTDEPVAHFGLGEAEVVESLEIEWPSGARQRLEGLQAGNRYTVSESASGSEDSSEPSQATLFTPAAIDVPEETVTSEEYFQMFPTQMHIPFVETRRGPPMLVEDLDGDGWMDVVLGGPTGLETRVFRNVDGKRLELVESEAFEDDFDCEDRDIDAFDYDSDGDLDLLVTSGGIELDEGDVYYQDRIYLNAGDLQFERLDEDLFPAPTESSSQAQLMDVEGDGDLDILVGGGTRKGRYPQHEDNLLWLREGDGFVLDKSSAFAQAFRQSGNINDFLLADLDGDGDFDLSQAVEWGSPRFWYRENGEYRSRNPAQPTESLRGVWRSLASGDFDGDGRLDVVLGGIGLNTRYRPSEEEPNVLLSSNNKYLDNTYIEARSIEGQLYPVETRDIQDYQFPDLMEKQTTSVEAYANMTIEQIFPAELLDKYERYYMTETRSMILYQNEEGGFSAQPLPTEAQSGIAADIVVADPDGDGRDDLLMAFEMHPLKVWADRVLRGHVFLLQNQGGRDFEALWPWQTGLGVDGYPRQGAFADMDNDGEDDLLIALNEGPLLVYAKRK